MTEPPCTCTCTYARVPGEEPPGTDPDCPAHAVGPDRACTCLPPGGGYESYEGPQRDCPVHGEVIGS